MSDELPIVKRLRLVDDWRDAIPTMEEAADLITELVAALEPFARVAEHDIGEDEMDDDLFRPITQNHAPKLRVGHLRDARAAVEKAQK